MNYEGRVRVPIGASVVINGLRDSCDGPPPAWDDIVNQLPSTRLGSFSDGGLGRQVSQQCRREVVVRAVRFTGENKGSEGVRIVGAYTLIDVFAADPARPEHGQ